MKKLQLKRSVIAIAVSGGLAAMPLQAQMLEEVIVTATKRPAGMQDVPIALSVMSGEKILEAGITNLEDLAVFMPNVHIAEGSSSDSIFIRGVGSGINFGFEQSVGTFIDGVYFGRAQASRSAFLDIERVEILKGSQSTLFGKNTIAGAINITTAKPTEEFEAIIDLTAEPEFGGQSGTLTLSGPITDNLGARLVLRADTSDGWMDNNFINAEEQEKDNQVGRLTLAWQPTDNLDVTFKYENGTSDTTGTNETITVATPSAVGFYTAADPNFAQNSGFGYDKSEATFGSPRPRAESYHDSEWDIVTLTAEWALGEHTLTSITGYVDYSFETIRDSDYSAIIGIGRFRDESHKQFTQEFLLTSPQSDSFEYLAGFFYQDEDLEHDRYTDLSLKAFADVGVPIADVIGSATSAGIGALAASGAFDGTGNNTFNQTSETLSAFFQGTFHFSDTLRLIAGIRYSEDEKEFDKSAIVAPLFTTGPSAPVLESVFNGLGLSTAHVFKDGQAVVLGAPAVPLNTVRNEEHVTGDITVQWDFSDQTMLYAKIGNGYKAGGFDEDNALANLDAQEYEDEGSETIELGAKMDLWDSRGRLNVAVFRSEFEDVQVSTFDGTAGFVVGNAAESEVTGIELDGMFAVSDEITVSGAVAFLDAKYKSFTDAACNAPQAEAHTASGATGPCLNDLSGERLQFAADVSASLGISYITEITDSLELGLSTDIMYTDDFDTAADADPVLVQDAYTKVNARISIADLSGKWTVALLAKNITDETTSAWGNDIPLGAFGFNNSYFQIIDAPRSYEIQARYNF